MDHSIQKIKFHPDAISRLSKISKSIGDSTFLQKLVEHQRSAGFRFSGEDAGHFQSMDLSTALQEEESKGETQEVGESVISEVKAFIEELRVTYKEDPKVSEAAAKTKFNTETHLLNPYHYVKQESPNRQTIDDIGLNAASTDGLSGSGVTKSTSSPHSSAAGSILST